MTTSRNSDIAHGIRCFSENRRVLSWAIGFAIFASQAIALAPEASALRGEALSPVRVAPPVPASDVDVGRFAERFAPTDAVTPSIILAQQKGFSVEDISGPAGKELAVDIRLPPDDGDLFRVIMVRGLPENVQLTKGISLDDAWVVSPSEIEQLAIVSPADYSGEFSLEVLFIRGNRETREREIVNVRIGLADQEDVADDASADRTDPTPPRRTTISPELQKSMFERASRLMRGGDIAGARLILKYLAQQGMAGAAYAMGQSFDPGFLSNMYIQGGDPSDVEEARLWYRRAADMGNPDAKSRLSALQNSE